jgi:SAM-dependent methyltransferase
MRLTESLILRTPSLKALLCQILAFFFALFVFALFSISADDHLLSLLLFAGALAAIFSFFFRLDWWWWVFGFFFPMFVATAVWVDLPAWIYPFGFFVLTAVYWSVFVTRVPYFPTAPQIFPEIQKLIPQQGQFSFCEIGSGLGDLSLYLAKRHPHAQVLGVEIAPLPWLVSVIKAHFARLQTKFIRGNYESLDFSQFDVIYAYLSPAAMPDLWRKAQAEMKVGSLLISYEFTIPDFPPDLCVNIATNETFIYIWRI